MLFYYSVLPPQVFCHFDTTLCLIYKCSITFPLPYSFYLIYLQNKIVCVKSSSSDQGISRSIFHFVLLLVFFPKMEVLIWVLLSDQPHATSTIFRIFLIFRLLSTPRCDTRLRFISIAYSLVTS